jgi:hypothetical protein
MEKEVRKVEGSFKYSESACTFRVTVGYKCPFCARRHVQHVSGAGNLPSGVTVTTKCEQGHVVVVPYAATVAYLRKKGNRLEFLQ